MNIASNIRYYSTIVNGNALDFDTFVDETRQITEYLQEQAAEAVDD